MTVWDVLLIIVSCLLITIIVLQESKEDANAAFTGEKSELFANRKERGGELIITRATFILGALFFIICLVLGF